MSGPDRNRLLSTNASTRASKWRSFNLAPLAGLLLLPAAIVAGVLGFALLLVLFLIGMVAATALGIWFWRYRRRLQRQTDASVIEGEFTVVPEMKQPPRR